MEDSWTMRMPVDPALECVRQMLGKALDAEAEEYIERHRTVRCEDTRHAVVVRNGRARPRTITIGKVKLEVEAPRVFDLRCGQRFASRIVPPYRRSSTKLRPLLDLVHQQDLSTRDLGEALSSLLLGVDLEPSRLSRLAADWETTYRSFR